MALLRGNELQHETMSGIMSDMKTATKTTKTARRQTVKTQPEVFTVRDMNRDTAAVLEACRQHGQVLVRHRSGEQFAITVLKEGTTAGQRPSSPERIRQAQERMLRHRARMRAMGVRGPLAAEGIEHLNRVIAGEA